MLTSVLIVTFGAVIYFIIDKKNSYYRIITLYLFSICAILFSAFLYASKTNLYPYNQGLDYMLLSYFSKIKLHITNISRMYTLSIAMFMLSSLLLLRKITKMHTVINILLASLIAVFVLVNDFSFTKFLYIKTILNPVFWNNVLSLCSQFTETLFWIFLILPIPILFVQCLKNKIFLNREYNMFLLTAVIILHSFVIFVLRKTYANIWFLNLDFVRLPINHYQTNSHFAIPVMLLILFLIITVISYWLKPINSIEFITLERWLEQNDTLSDSLGMMIHTYKNAFIAIRQQLELANVYLQRGNAEQSQNHITRCNEIINTQLNSIGKTLRKLRCGKVTANCVDLIECIHSAANCINTDITIELCDECYILGDYDALCEVFTNILYNAEYALLGRENPQIKITLIKEDDLCEVDFRDNGCGISRQNLKKIFSPFFSTKPALSSGGLGLNYVKSMVKAHRGDIRIKSVENEYTLVKLAFPLYKSTKTERRSKNELNQNYSV